MVTFCNAVGVEIVIDVSMLLELVCAKKTKKCHNCIIFLTAPPMTKMRFANILVFMKNSIFISSLLAVCVTSVAPADEYVPELKGSKNVVGDLTTNHIELTGNSTVSVTGKTTIDSNTTSGYACRIQSGSTLESGSIIFNSSTEGNAKAFSIQGSVKTDEFVVSAAEGYSAKISVTAGGSLKSLSTDTQGTLTVGANATVSVGSKNKKASGSLDMNTVVNGGTFGVQFSATAGDVTLKDGVVQFSGDSDSSVGDVTMEAGTLEISGDIKTGALSLYGGTVEFLGDYVVDLGESDLILGDNVAITLNVASLEDISGVTLFKTTGNVDGLDELTVTFVDAATGAEKKAAVSFSNGAVVTAAVPEPTTVTLSLLALCGLAARRRRK